MIKSKLFIKTLWVRFIILVMVILAIRPYRFSKPIRSPILTLSWQTDHQAIWEIEWPGAPIGGAVVAQSWRSGTKYRLEILESSATALLGETLIFDGQQAWRYNRLAQSPTITRAQPILSPVTDAFDLVDQFLTRPPTSATQRQTYLLTGPTAEPATEIRLIFDKADELTAWLNPTTKLPLRMKIVVKDQVIWLKARQIEPFRTIDHVFLAQSP